MRTWVGAPPEQCDICKQSLGDHMIDGKTVDGPWAIMCEVCHEEHGFGLGTGVGQLYKRHEGTWEKIGG